MDRQHSAGRELLRDVLTAPNRPTATLRDEDTSTECPGREDFTRIIRLENRFPTAEGMRPACRTAILEHAERRRTGIGTNGARIFEHPDVPSLLLIYQK